MIIKSFFAKQEGFTMIELIVTVALLTFGIAGIFSFFQPASILTSNLSLHPVADYLSQEGLEVIKNIRDDNILQGFGWSSGLTNCVDGCQADYKTFINSPADQLPQYQDIFLNLDSDGFYSHDQGTATLFKRKITIIQPGQDNNVLRVAVLVSWGYSGRSFSYETIGYIYNLGI